MITAVLLAAVVWCLFYSRIPSVVLVPICAVIGLVLALLGRRKHTQFLTIDVMAQTSRLHEVNPFLKFWTALALMALSVSARSPIVGIFLTVAVLILIVYAGGLKLRDYISFLTLPVSFLLLGGLALLFEVTMRQTGVLNIHVAGLWLCVSTSSQLRAALVMSRALGAVSCLYLLSLTTPMSDIIGVLRRMHCPNVLIELMYLIYRYVFILLSMHHMMRDAAKSRMGYADYRTSVRTTGNIYTNLLARSYRRANGNFDAMESRCYDTEIHFLEKRKKITGIQTAAAIAITILTLSLSLFLR